MSNIICIQSVIKLTNNVNGILVFKYIYLLQAKVIIIHSFMTLKIYHWVIQISDYDTYRFQRTTSGIIQLKYVPSTIFSRCEQ